MFAQQQFKTRLARAVEYIPARILAALQKPDARAPRGEQTRRRKTGKARSDHNGPRPRRDRRRPRSGLRVPRVCFVQRHAVFLLRRRSLTAENVAGPDVVRKRMMIFVMLSSFIINAT
jgi:hypothetical protein